eukprot:Stramenopile-MAST_4_protein_1653
MQQCSNAAMREATFNDLLSFIIKGWLLEELMVEDGLSLSATVVITDRPSPAFHRRCMALQGIYPPVLDSARLVRLGGLLSVPSHAGGMTLQWHARLQKRNERETYAFVEIVHVYESLLREKRIVEEKLENADKEIKLRIMAAASNAGDSGARGASPAEKAELEMLRSKVYQLQEELNSKLKLDVKSATSQLELTTSQQDMKSKLHTTQQVLAEQASIVDAQKLELEELQRENTKQKEALDLFRQEVLRLRQQNAMLAEKAATLENDNGMLVNRILSEKEKSSRQINDMNVLIEQMRGNSGLLKLAQKMPAGKAQTSRQSLSSKGPGGGGTVYSSLEGSFTGSSLPNAAVHAARAHDGSDIYGVCYTRDGQRLATCSSDGLVKVWSSKSLERAVCELRGNGTAFMDVDWFDGNIIAGGVDGCVHMWDSNTQRIKHKMTGHKQKVLTVKFSTTGKAVISGSSDRTIKLWDTKTGYVTRTIDCTSVCNSVDLSPDGVTLVSGHQDGSIRSWDIRNGARAHEVRDVHKMPVAHVQFSYQGTAGPSNFVMSSCRDNKIRVFDSISMELVREFGDSSFRVPTNSASASFSPDALYCCAGSSDGALHIWDVTTGKSVRMMKKHNTAVHACVWRPDGKQVATVDKKGYCASDSCDVCQDCWLGIPKIE